MDEGFRPPDNTEFVRVHDSLPQLLATAVELARTDLLKGDPTRWPAVWFTLCLLWLIDFNLEDAPGFTDTLLTAQNTLRGAIESLAQLYLHCCGDLHPLNEEGVDRELFKLICGAEDVNTSTTLERFLEFNDIWVESSE